MTRSGIQSCVLVALLVAPACSTVVGADFGGLMPIEVGGDGGSSAAGGAGGNASASGGSGAAGLSGGEPGNAGEPSIGGASGSAGSLGVGGALETGAGGAAGASGLGGAGGRGGAGAGASGLGDAGGHGGAGAGGASGFGGNGAAGTSTSGVGGSIDHGGSGGVAGSGGASGAGGSRGYVSPTGLVLNELKGQGTGPDYIELFNRTQEPLDIAGCYVSDDSNNRVTFPTGASIAATSYVLVRLQQSTSTGLVTSCLGYTPCYDGITWGISASGEAVSLRDAKGTLLDQLAYPDQNGADGLLDGQALGRVPDGGTVVTAILVSPGAANNAAP